MTSINQQQQQQQQPPEQQPPEQENQNQNQSISSSDINHSNQIKSNHHNPIERTLEQLTLTIQCLDQSLPTSTPEDPIYSKFKSTLSHEDLINWSELQFALQSIISNPSNLKRGIHGLESVIQYFYQIRRHPTWNDHDILLQPILENLLSCLIDRCTQPDSTVTPLTPIAVPDSSGFSASTNDLTGINADQHSSSLTTPSLQNPSHPSDSLLVPSQSPPEPNRLATLRRDGSSPPPSTGNRKRNSTTVAHKLHVIEHHNREGATQKQTAKKFGLTQSQLSRWLKEEDELREYVMDKGSSSKRQRTGDFPQIEDALLRYFIEAKSRNITPSDDNLKDRAKAFMRLYGIPDDALKVSNGWLLRFKGRNNVKSYIRPAPPLFLESRIETVREQLRLVTDGFALRDIYAADEVGLYTNLAPLTGPLCVNPPNRPRSTYLLCANADGSDKRPPLCIGSSTNPSNYIDPQRTYPYRYTTHGWMTAPVFSEWIKKFDREMQRQDRRVLLLIDNFSAHVYDADSLINTRVHFFPTSSVIQTQPMYAGIMKTFKSNFRRELMQNFLSEFERAERLGGERVDEQVQAMRFASKAWEDITDETIRNCFKHTGILSARSTEALPMYEPSSSLLTSSFGSHSQSRPQFASDLDMEKSLMATQSALIQFQRDCRMMIEERRMGISIEEVLDLKGEEDRDGWERMPSDEELIEEARFFGAQVKDESAHRRKDEKDPHAHCLAHHSLPLKRKMMVGSSLAEEGIGGEGRKLKPLGGLEIIPLSVQEVLKSLEQIEYSLPFYLSNECFVNQILEFDALKIELRKVLLGPPSDHHHHHHQDV